jgi:hypothetical protein
VTPWYDARDCGQAGCHDDETEELRSDPVRVYCELHGVDMSLVSYQYTYDPAIPGTLEELELELDQELIRCDSYIELCSEVEVEEPTGVERASWGVIKAMYR